jgi:hypothetical protein
MNCSRTAFIALLVLASLINHRLAACTIVAINKNHRVLVGNNEDWSDPDSKVWLQSPEKGKYGRIFFGFKNGWTQGGMNEKGLFFDWVKAFDEEPPADLESKIISAGNLCETILEKASTVEEAIKYYQIYAEPSFSQSRILFADASGNSAIIGWENHHVKIWPKKGWYQVLSARERVLKAEELLNQHKYCSVEGLRSLMQDCTQKGDYPTRYTNICDLKKGVVYLYDLLNNRELAVLNLQDEFAKGPHFYNLPKLPAQLELPPLTDGKTWRPVNIDPSVLTQLEGLYKGDSGLGVIVTSIQGKLYGKLENVQGPAAVMEPASDRIFYLPYTDAQVIFLFNSENRVTQLVFLQSAMGDMILNKLE